jgi:hypothetical protein
MYILLMERLMARKKPRKTPSRVSEPKTAVSYRLSRDRIARAQKILGSATATATIEEALDAVVFRRELMDGVRRTAGLPIIEAFPDGDDGRRRSAT